MPESIERQVSNAEKEITRSIQKGVKKTVRLVKKRLKQVNTKAVNRLVYRKYTPMFYIRRKTNGGLSDPKNITFDSPTYALNYETSSANCILQFHNVTRPNPINYLPPNHKLYGLKSKNGNFYKTVFLSSMIEYGYGNKRHPWNKPRPFMDNTEENGIKQIIEQELSNTVPKSDPDDNSEPLLYYNLKAFCLDEIKKLGGITE